MNHLSSKATEKQRRLTRASVEEKEDAITNGKHKRKTEERSTVMIKHFIVKFRETFSFFAKNIHYLQEGLVFCGLL